MMGVGGEKEMSMNLTLYYVKFDFNLYDILSDLQERRFAWSRELRGWVLSSYYIGYILTQIPSGWIAKRYGAKWTLEIGKDIAR